MKRIHYASGTFVTGDRIADVLVRYAAVLAKSGAAAEVNAPVIDEDGSMGSALMLLGPASQILAETTPGDSELEDPEFVAAIERSIASLGLQRAGFVKTDPDEAEAIDPDYL